MAKSKSVFFCQECGAQSPKWIGKCPSCNSWNSYVEEVIQKDENSKSRWQPEETGSPKRKGKPQKVTEIAFEKQTRIKTPGKELDRVLGGGIVPGSLVLLGGEPGIGKSTLLLQLSLRLKDVTVLYVSGEESESQIKMRAERIGITNELCYILSETNTKDIFKQVEEIKPQILVIDSIQTLHSPFIESTAGSVSQVRECTGELMKFAKESNTPVFIVGHITKDGNIAGPKILEHMVDTVLQFEGDRHMTYRIVRSIKNRFGSTSELGIYEMIGAGLREVSNPSEILITQREGNTSGVAIGASVEGNRPLLVEVQALVSIAAYHTPQRSSTGFDAKRLNMVLAVLEKRCGLKVSTQDVFLNIAGGLKVEDPAIDLAICVAIISSFEELPLAGKSAFAGEIGLGGEVRTVTKIDQRISEAEKLGFEVIYVSKFNKISEGHKIEIRRVSKLRDVFEELFG